jgi:hypothetical protein
LTIPTVFSGCLVLAVLGYPPAVLLQPSRNLSHLLYLCFPVLTVMSWPFCPVQADLSRLTSPGCPLRPTCTDLPVQAVLSHCHSRCRALDIMSRLYCHVCPATVVLSQMPIPCCYVLAIFSSLSCPAFTIPTVFSDCPVPAVLSSCPLRLSSPAVLSGCLVLAALPWLSCTGSLRLSCPNGFALAVLPWLSCPSCPAPAFFPELFFPSALSLLSCYHRPVLSVLS